MNPRKIPGAIVCLTAIVSIFAEAPLEVSNARDVRNRIPDYAKAYLGVPYVLGGNTSGGLDCSGFVFVVFEDATGEKIPRTVKTLYGYTERIALSKLEPGDVVFFNTTGPLSHVGIYLGDSEVIHAASDGPKRGVIISSLNEKYYSNAYYDVGRIIPSGGWIGIFVDIGMTMNLGGTGMVGGKSLVAGGNLSGRVSYNLFGIYPGVELKLDYDPTAQMFSVPFLLSVGIGKQLRFSAGTTLAFSGTTFTSNGTSRTLKVNESFFNTFGVEYRIFSLGLFGVKAGLDAGLTWTNMVPVGGIAYEPFIDIPAGLRAEIGLNVQLDF